ncbi:anti-anti-sigma factor [Streptomyces cinerochromogenes]|uniref:Anti-anti-sigma factor n=1 Tax=Streptomyces cinerochromogenes TaxID=66422 RepID=A0ABW7B3X5_9ACTN
MTGSSATRPGPAPVPAPALGDVLPVTLQGAPHDGAAEQLQHDAHRIASGPAPVGGVVIDISGPRPAVAVTLAEPGLILPGPDTAPDVHRALFPLGHGPPATPSAHPEEGA